MPAPAACTRGRAVSPLDAAPAQAAPSSASSASTGRRSRHAEDSHRHAHAAAEPDRVIGRLKQARGPLGMRRCGTVCGRAVHPGVPAHAHAG